MIVIITEFDFIIIAIVILPLNLINLIPIKVIVKRIKVIKLLIVMNYVDKYEQLIKEQVKIRELFIIVNFMMNVKMMNDYDDDQFMND